MASRNKAVRFNPADKDALRIPAYLLTVGQLLTQSVMVLMGSSVFYHRIKSLSGRPKSKSERVKHGKDIRFGILDWTGVLTLLRFYEIASLRAWYSSDPALIRAKVQLIVMFPASLLLLAMRYAAELLKFTTALTLVGVAGLFMAPIQAGVRATHKKEIKADKAKQARLPALSETREHVAGQRRSVAAEARSLLSSEADEGWINVPLDSPTRTPSGGLERTL